MAVVIARMVSKIKTIIMEKTHQRPIPSLSPEELEEIYNWMPSEETVNEYFAIMLAEMDSKLDSPHLNTLRQSTEKDVTPHENTNSIFRITKER